MYRKVSRGNSSSFCPLHVPSTTTAPGGSMYSSEQTTHMWRVRSSFWNGLGDLDTSMAFMSSAVSNSSASEPLSTMARSGTP